MTADEFVAALKKLAADAEGTGRDDVKPWGSIRDRPPAFDHPVDPVLDLLARYDVSEVTFWGLGFATRTTPDGDDLWHVAKRSMDDYYVQDGQFLHMYYKAEYPDATGLSSGSFLDVLSVYARMISEWAGNPLGPHDPLVVEYANRAAAVSPHAAGLDWFWESRR